MFQALVLIVSFLKFGKILTVLGTMALSVLAYSLIFGWRYALGFVVLIFIHEMGHFLAARHKGLHVGMPTFIPFVGAWIDLKDKPHNAETEAYVGFAGPLLGTLGALLCYGLSLDYEQRLLLALSYAGFFINLFNLIPLSPFDGGRITAVLSPRLWFFGVPILIGLFLWHPNPLLIAMAILAAPQLRLAFKFNPKAPENVAYYSTSLRTKITYSSLYLGLAAFLSIMSFEIHNQLSALSAATIP